MTFRHCILMGFALPRISILILMTFINILIINYNIYIFFFFNKPHYSSPTEAGWPKKAYGLARGVLILQFNITNRFSSFTSLSLILCLSETILSQKSVKVELLFLTKRSTLHTQHIFENSVINL